MLTCTCFGNNPLLTHALCQQCLTEGIINFVRSGMG
jgi:hypothetical protein